MTTLLKPIGKNILVKLHETSNVTKGGIILQNLRTKREQRASVIAVGSQVENCKVGDEILFNDGKFRIIKGDMVPDTTHDYAIMLDDDVIGLFS